MKYLALNLVGALLFVVFLIGCTGKSISTSLPECRSLYADSIETPPVLLSVTSLFTLGDDTLGVYQSKDDTLFSFWKLPECTFLFRAGIKGQGPNDFLELDRTFKGRAGGFQTFEIQTGKVKDVTFGKGGRLTIESKKLELGEMVNRFIFLKDKTYCFFLLMGETEFGLYSEKEGLRHVGQYPNQIVKKEGEVNALVYNKLTVAHPKGDKFAAFYAYLKMCRIYASDGTLLKEKYLDGPVELETGMRKAYYSTQPFATDEHIYVLSKEPEGNVLEVWSWDAEMTDRYLLDKEFDKFIVRQGKLYGINREVESLIYTFDLGN